MPPRPLLNRMAVPLLKPRATGAPDRALRARTRPQVMPKPFDGPEAKPLDHLQFALGQLLGIVSGAQLPLGSGNHAGADVSARPVRSKSGPIGESIVSTCEPQHR